MFNEARFFRTLTAKEREAFQSGVCGNEALHNELKDAVYHCAMHPETLNMKLDIFKIKKLLLHNTMVYHPTLRPMTTQLEVLSRRVASLDFWPGDASWTSWCAASNVRRRGLIPVRGVARALESARLRQWIGANRSKAADGNLRPGVKKALTRHKRRSSMKKRLASRK